MHAVFPACEGYGRALCRWKSGWASLLGTGPGAFDNLRDVWLLWAFPALWGSGHLKSERLRFVWASFCVGASFLNPLGRWASHSFDIGSSNAASIHSWQLCFRFVRNLGRTNSRWCLRRTEYSNAHLHAVSLPVCVCVCAWVCVCVCVCVCVSVCETLSLPLIPSVPSPPSPCFACINGPALRAPAECSGVRRASQVASSWAAGTWWGVACTQARSSPRCVARFETSLWRAKRFALCESQHSQGRTRLPLQPWPNVHVTS